MFQVLSFSHTKQTSKNVADTTFKLFIVSLGISVMTNILESMQSGVGDSQIEPNPNTKNIYCSKLILLQGSYCLE